MTPYQPPLTITPQMLARVAEISEQVGRLAARQEAALTPQLRRGNRIRTIQASLAIEHNSLSVEQVTAVLDGKRVLGLPREIQEVRNAFAAYDAMPRWQPQRQADLLAAHGLLLHGLIDDAGHYRRGGVGIYRDGQLLHMAPPASRVAELMQALLHWLGHSDWHPLLASCVFHYEFEFIHPFADGNGRMGRLWQTLILSQWRPVMAYLPVETVIRDQQSGYYAALAAADQRAEATPFVEFMLAALQQAMVEAERSDQLTDQVTDQVTEQLTDQVTDQVTEQLTDQVTEQVSDQVARLLQVLLPGEQAKASELMQRLGLSHRPTFTRNYLKPALAAGLVEMTAPAAPHSPAQKYRRSPR